MKKLICAIAALVGAVVAGVCAAPLKFNADGTFKIVQFTDLHYIADDPRADIALERMAEVLDAERPDLVMITGDLIFGKPADASLRRVLDVVASRKYPFAVTFGNHDDELGLSRQQLLDIILTYPGNLTATTPGLPGVTNYTLPVKSHDGTRDAEILYVLDSHSRCKLPGVGGYDYIKPAQIDWYRTVSDAYTRANGGVPVPSLAFFHIALPEYAQAAADQAAVLHGFRKEKVCSPKLNSGLFLAMKEKGDVNGIFVGHDHDNDYAVMWNGILLAYGRYTGGNTVYNNLTNGARIITLTEGRPGFTTWIRLKDGRIEQYSEFPKDFEKAK